MYIRTQEVLDGQAIANANANGMQGSWAWQEAERIKADEARREAQKVALDGADATSQALEASEAQLAVGESTLQAGGAVALGSEVQNPEA